MTPDELKEKRSYLTGELANGNKCAEVGLDLIAELERPRPYRASWLKDTAVLIAAILIGYAFAVFMDKPTPALLATTETVHLSSCKYVARIKEPAEFSSIKRAMDAERKLCKVCLKLGGK